MRRSGPFKTKTINGTRVEIYVNADGMFVASIAGDWVKADTLIGLEAQLRKVTKKIKIPVAVPVSVIGYEWSRGRSCWVSGYGARHVTLTGLSADGRVRYRDDATDDAGYLDDITGGGWGLNSSHALVRRLTADDVTRYVELAHAYRVAKDALSEWRRINEVRAESLVEDALAAAAEPQAPEPDDDPRPLVGKE